MKAHLCVTVLLACVAPSAVQEDQRGTMPRELKPQWQRLLTGDDAKKAAELEERIAATDKVGSRAEVSDLAALQSTLAPDQALVCWVDVTVSNGSVLVHWVCVVRSSGDPRWEPLPGTWSTTCS